MNESRRKLALITGGTSGIGSGIAESLVKHYDLALSYASHHDRARTSREHLLGIHPEATIHCFPQPLSSEADCQALLSEVDAKFQKPVSVLVNSAGRVRDGLYMGTPIEDHIAMIREHLEVPMILSRLLVKSMTREKFGRILNLSSITARRFKMGQVNYSAAKGGIESFTKALAREVAHRGVTVNGIAPGLIETPMTAEIVAELKSDRKALRKRIPAGHVGSPADVGRLAAFLCAPECGYITGQIIDVCGGRSLVGD